VCCTPSGLAWRVHLNPLRFPLWSHVIDFDGVVDCGFQGHAPSEPAHGGDRRVILQRIADLPATGVSKARRGST
jgi:hypothetical protein